MIIVSEITGGQYKTVEDCLAAEKEFALNKEAEEKAKKEKAEAEAKRQKELNDAYERAINACEEYLKLAGVDVNIKRFKDDDDEWFAAIRTNHFMDGMEQILDSIIDSI